MNMNTALIERQKTLKSMLTASTAAIRESLPATVAKHLTPERLIRMAARASWGNDRLGECTPESICSSVIEAGSMGLECDGILGQGYLVPRWNKRQNRYVATFQIGYRGLCTLARRSGEITTIDAEAVYAGDEFEYHKGLKQDLRHVPKADVLAKETLTHAWAMVTFKDGNQQFRVMTKAQIEAVRVRSDAQKEGKEGGPWSSDYAAMAVKTVLKQLLKYVPLSSEDVSRAVEIDSRRDAGEDAPSMATPAGDDFLPPSEPMETVQPTASTAPATGATEYPVGEENGEIIDCDEPAAPEPEPEPTPTPTAPATGIDGLRARRAARRA